MATLYLLATDTKKFVADLIIAKTGEPFNHVSLSFSRSLQVCHSFSISAGGYVAETPGVWPPGTRFELFAVSLTEEGFRRARDYVEGIAGEPTSFSYAGLAALAAGLSAPEREAMFCAEFVERVCRVAGLRPVVPISTMATPYAVCRRLEPTRRIASGVLLHHIGQHLSMSEKSRPLILSKPLTLTEGFASFVKNLTTGNIEKQIAEIRNDVKDVHTPEQQRIVATKLVGLLERLIVLRHNPSFVGEVVHDSAAWFERVLGGKDAGKELKTRISEHIAELARLRDVLLAKRWTSDEDTARLEKLKTEVREKLRDAESQKVEE